MSYFEAAWSFIWASENRAWTIPCAITLLLALISGIYTLFFRSSSVVVELRSHIPSLPAQDAKREGRAIAEKAKVVFLTVLGSVGRGWETSLAFCVSCLRRLRLWIFYYWPTTSYSIPESNIPQSDGLYLQMRESTTFYWHRFTDAFPGLRESRVFTEVEDIAHRLSKLLAYPLSARAETEERQMLPIWWTRGLADMHIDCWYRLKKDVFLLDHKELKITKIFAIPGAVYWQNFVYVECEPLSPTGLYNWPPEYTDGSRERPFAEEFAVYGRQLFTREEYDDGGYERKGRAYSFRKWPQLRERYLTRYNFLLVPVGSPVRAHQFAQPLNIYLDDCLAGRCSDTQLADWLLSLPRNQ